MGFLRRHCWYCAAGEGAHLLVAVKRRSPFEYSAFVVCPECQMPSCAVLRSATAVDLPDATIIACEGDVQESSWRVIDLWPRAADIATGHSKRAPAEGIGEPAERTYKRALDIAKHINSNVSDQFKMDNLAPAADMMSSTRGEGGYRVTGRRLTLREFSERFMSSRNEREA